MVRYVRPGGLDEAVSLLGSGEDWLIMAGGTDGYPAHVTKPLCSDILDVTAIDAMQGITDHRGRWRLGATTTWSELLETPLPPAFDALKQAAAAIGGQQIQNTATIGGNICNASPAADGTVVLMAMAAEVELTSSAGTRRLPLEQFVKGNRHIDRRADELLTAIHVNAQNRAISHFLKLGSRRYLVISIVMVAVVLDLDAAGSIDGAGITVGACGPVAKRLTVLEQRLIGQACHPGLADLVDPGCLGDLTPIDDIRATASYRSDAVLTLLRRALSALTSSVDKAA